MLHSPRIVQMTRSLRWCAVLVGIFALAPFAAHATTFTVNSNADGVGICPGATCTLRQAILTAGPGDTIDFAAGLPTINLTSGELAINKNLTISGPGANLLTVQRSSASGTPSFRIFHLAGNISITISGLTISNGGDSAFGGGIFNDGATLTITDCIISGNTTSSQNFTGNGGGIYNLNGTLNISHSTLSGNSAYESGGAASNSGGTLTIDGCLISGNSANDPFGGSGAGIFNDNGGTVSITNSTLSNNNAPSVASNFGGAVYNRNGTLTVTTSTLSNNKADNGSGIFNGNGDTSNGNGALATITDSTISGNSGGSSRSQGGGIFNTETLHIVRSTISGNISFDVGGGISNDSTGTATITSSTIAGNSTNRGGGGIFNLGSVVARNTIIARNSIRSGGTGNTPDFQGTLTSQGFNLIGNGFGASITPAQSTDQIGTAASPIDPLLGPLQDNGGPTFTAALLGGSPAKDKGDSGGSNTDQRGFPRPVDNPAIPNATGGDGSDIGAFEVQESAAVSWGFNGNGQVGDGTIAQRTSPVPFGDLQDVVGLASGVIHNVALRADGGVWTCGSNAAGQLGIGNTDEQHSPVPVTGLPSAISVSAGSYFSVAVTSDKKVWAWGGDGSGELGDGGGANKLSPTQVTSVTGIIQVSAGGAHVLALSSDGSIWAWGEGDHGQLGNGSFPSISVPVHVLGLTDCVAVSAGGAHSLALKSDGTVWAWGYDLSGQLGDSGSADRSSPVQVPGLTGVVSIAAGETHSLAVKPDGTVWAWGENHNGQLGDGTINNHGTPQQVHGLAGAKLVGAGSTSSNGYAILNNGSLWSWGAAATIGDGTTTERDLPVQVTGLSGVRAISGGFQQAIAVGTITPAKSLNISTRARVRTGDNVLIGGFIITGKLPKQVVLRGLGPSLVNSGLPAPTVLSDPVLELRGASGALITLNDNWKDSPQRAQIEATGLQPTDDREAVILTTLPPASYTAVVSGKANGQGLGLVEVYDLDQSSDSALANISSRAFVETGNNVVIGGFTMGGNNGTSQIIIRGLGPSLSMFGIADVLANPTLELRDANASLLASDDDWRDDPAQASQITAAGLQPQNDLEAAIAAALPPGAYTAILAGQNGGTGVGTVEIYNLQ